MLVNKDVSQLLVKILVAQCIFGSKVTKYWSSGKPRCRAVTRQPDHDSVPADSEQQVVWHA